MHVTPADTIQSVLAAVTKRMQMHDDDTIRTIHKGLAECRGLVNPINLGKSPSVKGFIPGLTNLTSITFAGTYVHSTSNTQQSCCTRNTRTQFNTALTKNLEPVLQLQSMVP